MAFVKIGNVICRVWPIMCNQSYIEGGMLDIKNYLIIIISHQLRDKDLLYGDILSNCLEGKICNVRWRK